MSNLWSDVQSGRFYIARSAFGLKRPICFAEVRKNFPYAGGRSHMPLDRAIWAICGGAAGYGKKLEKVSSCGKILKILNSQNILKIPATPAAHARMTNNGNSANACSRKLFTKKFLKHLTKSKFWPAALVKGQPNCQTILTNA
jgi:hypothetical protein